MIMARDKNGKAIPAIREANGACPEAFCPCCRKRMTARVGDIRRPHWAHESGERCDEWWEEESDWRDGWLQVFVQSPNVDIENVLEKNGERHFYDARFGNSLVAVFRRTRLPPEQFVKREAFFGKMFWLIEANQSEYKRLRRSFDSHAIKAIYGSRRCYEDDEKRDSPFYARWRKCHAPVVFDFKQVSEGRVKGLWCVLPEQGSFKRRLLLFSRTLFINRLTAESRLLAGSIDEVNDKISVREQKYKAKLKLEMAKASFWGVTERQKTSIQPVASFGFEELVDEFLRCGFSRPDAERRAKLRLCRESK